MCNGNCKCKAKPDKAIVNESFDCYVVNIGVITQLTTHDLNDALSYAQGYNEALRDLGYEV